MSIDQDRLCSAIVRLVSLAAKLRGPGGCPWDAKQTDDSIKLYVLEEAHEVAQAIETGGPDDVCGELGDLLFQIVFLALLAQERGEFDFTDVIEKIEKKMIRRHPHVFGSTKVKDADEVAQNWAKIKEQEKKDKDCSHAGELKKIPAALPALLRAHRICERAQKFNFHFGNEQQLISELESEVCQLKQDSEQGDERGFANRIGRILFTLAALGQLKGKNAEEALRKSINNFLNSLEQIERALEKDGIQLGQADPRVLRMMWEKTGNHQ